MQGKKVGWGRSANPTIRYGMNIFHAYASPVIHFTSLVIRYRELTWELTKREITERYTGQVLGNIWALGHPLILIGTYLFIFGFLFPSRMNQAGEVPGNFSVYLLAGLIPWLTFSEIMGKASGVIISHASFVKQIVFPVEVLPLKGVLASCVTQAIMTLCLVLYVLTLPGISLNMLFFLPMLLVVQIVAMIGVSYFLSSIGTFFRDLKEMVQVVMRVGIFLTPIFYMPEWIEQSWPSFSNLLFANPFSHLVWCYQDIFFFGRFEHVWSWAIFMMFSGISFFGGYNMFRKVKGRFGDVL